jgi:hypothetical protein
MICMNSAGKGVIGPDNGKIVAKLLGSALHLPKEDVPRECHKAEAGGQCGRHSDCRTFEPMARAGKGQHRA